MNAKDSKKKMDIFFGIPIITNPYLTMPKTVPRSWLERLFSLPWHPLVKTKTIQVPDDKIYLINTRGTKLEEFGVGRPTYFCHPMTLPKLRKLLDDYNAQNINTKKE